MKNVRLVTESISSYVFTFVTKLSWMNKTLLKLRVTQWDSASLPNRKVPDSNPTVALSRSLGLNHSNVIFIECYVSENKKIRVSSS